MNEFELIERFFRRPPRSSSVAQGVGDDAALLAPGAGMQVVATVDMLVGGRHFFADVDPEALGARAADKAVRSQSPVALEPGIYPVVLEPAAVATLAGFLFTKDRRPLPR